MFNFGNNHDCWSLCQSYGNSIGYWRIGCWYLGIFSKLQPGKAVIDMTTSQPKLAVKIAEYATKNGFHALDAPVSGGDIGAKNATLTIMVGGETATYQAMQPLFKVIGHQVNHFGAAGTGQHAKMANQIMIAGTMTGLTEMLLYTKAAGLDPQKVFHVVEWWRG